MSNGKKILLIITGSVAAYKVLDLARELKRTGYNITSVLSRGGENFITPLSLAALSGGAVYSDLFSLKDESEMGHIRLSREADIILVAPASADIIAKMALGIADDLASSALLASDKKVLVAPAMNPQMWNNPAVQRNLTRIRQDGKVIIPPASGMVACGEYGEGRMAELKDIISIVTSELSSNNAGELSGMRALVTAGPTHERLDMVRFIGNYSSGKQGYAIAQALEKAGASVTLVSGSVNLPAPANVNLVKVESAEEMLAACMQAMPADIAVMAAAVADWRPVTRHIGKIKKRGIAPVIELKENPDILHAISHLPGGSRPRAVIGFAAEAENLLENSKAKLIAKGCDAIVANNISGGDIFGGEENEAVIVTRDKQIKLPRQSKADIAGELTKFIINTIKGEGHGN